MLFLTSWNANKVYADSGNVTNGESIAKNNNPQEGTPAVNDNAQIVDNGSTNGSTGISESPDSNRSNVIKSDNSRTTEPTGQANNKKVVSDANLTANDAQTKPTQQTAKSYAANSVVQRTKKLTGNAKLLADSKAQTDTKTDSNYSVTDNYPKDLMTYLPSDFDNKQEYAFEWLRNKNNNNIILTTNRTGDGEVYVYQDRTKVGTLAQNSSQPLYVTRRDIWEYDYQINIGTVYNDESAGIVQSNGYPLNIIYSSHAKDVDDAWYSTVSFFVPHKIPQTVTYKDSNGNVIDSLTHTQDGLTGQSYTTGLPSGSKYVQKGEYLANITHNGNGLISEFHDGYTCTKDYHDGISVTFTENDSRTTGTGTMDYVIYDGDVAVQWGYLAYGQSTNYTKYSDRYTIRHTIVNPYVPQTTNIVYQYKKLGNVVNTDPQGNTTTTQYTNDPNDPTKVKPVHVPSIPGYTTQVNGKTVTDKTIMPADPGQDTKITYVADAQKASVTYIDDKTGKALKGDELKGVTNAKSGYTTKSAIDTYTSLGYTLVSDDTKGNEIVFDNDDAVDQAFTVHLSHGKITVTPEKPGKPGEPVDPKNSEGPKYPNGTELDQVKRTGIQTIHYVGAGDKTPADDKQTFIFTREITFDNVTGKIISKTPWNVQSYTFGTVNTPVIPGYHADKAVAGGETVTPDDLNKVITVTYAPDVNPCNPSDHGDIPSPEPTPEPETTPNPTPDDQPDSETSSDAHFENAKPKDELDKTNPKKVAAYKKERKIIKTKIAKQGHTEIAEPIEDKVTRENNVKVVSDPVENMAAEPKLPQTGEADNSIIGLLGMLLASFAAMFGFDSLHSHDKKHKN